MLLWFNRGGGRDINVFNIQEKLKLIVMLLILFSSFLSQATCFFLQDFEYNFISSRLTVQRNLKKGNNVVHDTCR